MSINDISIPVFVFVLVIISTLFKVLLVFRIKKVEVFRAAFDFTRSTLGESLVTQVLDKSIGFAANVPILVLRIFNAALMIRVTSCAVLILRHKTAVGFLAAAGLFAALLLLLVEEGISSKDGTTEYGLWVYNDETAEAEG